MKKGDGEARTKLGNVPVVASLIFLFLLLLVFGMFVFVSLQRTSQQMQFEGSLFVSDAGQSHGGFEYTASWNVSLITSGTSGVLRLVFNVGLGDAINQHELHVSDFHKTSNSMAMRVDGSPVELIWTVSDSIWNHTYDGYYIASWGGFAPPSEIRGSISPEIFAGLASFWYVELRLK